jgi:hypothetical protein
MNQQEKHVREILENKLGWREANIIMDYISSYSKISFEENLKKEKARLKLKALQWGSFYFLVVVDVIIWSCVFLRK